MKNNNDENLLEELFEDFNKENEIKNENNLENKSEVKNNTITYIFLLIIFLLIIWIGIFSYLSAKDTEINNNETNNSDNSETNIKNNNIENNSENSFSIDNSNNNFDENYFSNLLIDKSWWINPYTRISNYWWLENIENIWEWKIKISYPKWSYKPSASPRWWAGFIYDLWKEYNKLSLSYTIKFDKNFNFVKWWKLPGLCWWNCARWWMSAEKWFSTRFVWKNDWYLDITKYSFKWWDYWDSLNKKFFKFIPWKEYNISQELVLNEAGKSNWSFVIKINWEIVYSDYEFEIIDDNSLKIDSLLFATFFWWNDISWSTPINTNIEFSNFQISDSF